MNNQALTLYELNMLVRETIERTFTHEYWVKAELSECRESRGHCYMQLIQKDRSSNTPIAQASARCWRNTWMMIKPYFERVTGQELHAGLEVMLQVYPQFHENYGFSWIVTDINPEFTMGDMARKRMEIIRQLKEEGVFDLNKQLDIPMFCQRIAVISSATAAGYGDFCNQLNENEYGFSFHTKLFPTVMQGEGVESGVIASLDRINERIDDFDCVVIIRGGGAVADLSGFDTLALAENVANFPLPVITGIGHDRDESVLDMISYTRVKTPTAAAEWLISHLAGTWNIICSAQDGIANMVEQRMHIEKMRLRQLSQQIPMLFSVVRERHSALLDSRLQRIRASIHALLHSKRYVIDSLNMRTKQAGNVLLIAEKHRLEQLELIIKSHDPQVVLGRGYSITLKDGKAVTDATLLKCGDEIETRMEKGSIKSIVK